MLPPSASYVAVPHSIFRNQTDGAPGHDQEGLRALSSVPAVSDHIPIAISFAQQRGRRPPQIPLWMADNPLFKDFFLSELAITDFDGHDVFGQRDLFVQVAFCAKKLYYDHKTQEVAGEISNLTKFTACIRAMRLLRRPIVDSPAVDRLIVMYPFLSDLLVKDAGGTDIGPLRGEADRRITRVADERRDEQSLSLVLLVVGPPF